jgi:hypothetical protein
MGGKSTLFMVKLITNYIETWGQVVQLAETLSHKTGGCGFDYG